MIGILLLGLAACQYVTSEKITAGDLARAVPEFAAVPSDTVLGYAPLPGACRTFMGGDIQRFAARFGVSAAFQGSVCFEWEMRTMERGQVLDAMHRSLTGEIELAEYSMFPVPVGEIVFPLASQSALLNQGMWRGYVRYAGDRRVSIWAKVKVPAPDVSKGEPVEVLVQTGAAQLKLDARAESAGSKGQMVSVRNISSGKTFMAEVTGKGSAMVAAK